MNHMTVNTFDAPWNKMDFVQTECHACGCELTEAEQIDPCIIQDESYCDKCASDLVQLKLDGYLTPVHDKTFRLKYDHQRGVFASLGRSLEPQY